MSADPFVSDVTKGYPYYLARDLKGEMVAVLQSYSENRGMKLLPAPSRAICKGQIHELVCTDEQHAAPGQTVNRTAYLGFFEVLQSGLLIAGSEVYYNEKFLGIIAGFDDTHMPNHYNILVRCSEWKTGRQRDFDIGGQIRIHKPDLVD